MKSGLAWRFQKLPHDQRVALREVMLRGAAREYVENVNSAEEEAAAAELRDAAIEYAVTVLQRAGAEPASRDQKRRKASPKETESE